MRRRAVLGKALISKRGETLKPTMCSCASTCPAQRSQHNAPPSRPPRCLRGPGPTPAARAAEVLRGSSRVSAAHPRPRLPLPVHCHGGAPGSRATHGGVGCARPRRGPGMAPQASQAAAGLRPLQQRLSRGAEEQPRGPAKAAHPPGPGLAAPERPALGPALHRGSAGRGRCKCRGSPRLASPALPSSGEIY